MYYIWFYLSWTCNTFPKCKKQKDPATSKTSNKIEVWHSNSIRNVWIFFKNCLFEILFCWAYNCLKTWNVKKGKVFLKKTHTMLALLLFEAARPPDRHVTFLTFIKCSILFLRTQIIILPLVLDDKLSMEVLTDMTQPSKRLTGQWGHSSNWLQKRFLLLGQTLHLLQQEPCSRPEQ